MAEQKSSDQKEFAGKGNFTWWVGFVEDRQDPLKLGRVRVRCLGWHSDNLMELPTATLPWAMPCLPVNSPNPYAPREGDMVFGFFQDGEAAQEPVIMGVLPGIPIKAGNPQEAFNDPRTQEELSKAPVKPEEKNTVNYPRQLDEPTTSRLARNEKVTEGIVGYKKAKMLGKVEPLPYYDAKYPYNNVTETESGHALEFDDTPGKERVHVYHRSGSYIEWGPAGDRAERIQKNKFTVVVGDEEVYIQGDVRVYIDGNSTVDIGGDAKLTVGGDMTTDVGGDIKVTAGGTITMNASQINLN
jgi:hypothetical protein